MRFSFRVAVDAAVILTLAILGAAAQSGKPDALSNDFLRLVYFVMYAAFFLLPLLVVAPADLARSLFQNQASDSTDRVICGIEIAFALICVVAGFAGGRREGRLPPTDEL